MKITKKDIELIRWHHNLGIKLKKTAIVIFGSLITLGYLCCLDIGIGNVSVAAGGLPLLVIGLSSVFGLVFVLMLLYIQYLEIK